MSILLTGGAGYVGSHAAITLLQAGHGVVLLDNFSNSQRGIVDRLRRATGRECALVEADVRDTSAVRRAIDDHACSGVMHFAGLKAVGDSVARPLDYYSNNVSGTISLLQAMEQTGVRELVFSSSATVYGEPRYLPLDEQHPTAAVNPYGRSKLHVERMLADVCASDAGWRVACLRYFNPVGAHDSAAVGEDPRGVPDNLMPCIALVAGGALPALNVFGTDYPTADGTGVRDYLHIMDLAEGHLAALRFLRSHPGWHAFNLGSGQGHSVLQVVNAFENASGRSVRLQPLPRRQGDVASSYADPSKAQKLLSWRAARTLQDMCESSWRWHIQAERDVLPRSAAVVQARTVRKVPSQVL